MIGGSRVDEQVMTYTDADAYANGLGAMASVKLEITGLEVEHGKSVARDVY
jgi:hypothetical protein